MLSPNGIVAVCENWLNNDRVWSGAKNSGLVIDCVWPVKGKEGKDPLFAVYVMRKGNDSIDTKVQPADAIRNALTVREKNGKWTDNYAKIMEAMSIPTFPS